MDVLCFIFFFVVFTCTTQFNTTPIQDSLQYSAANYFRPD